MPKLELVHLDGRLKLLHGEAGTALYDAIYLSARELEGRSGRKAIVLVTDGEPEDTDKCLAIRNDLVPRMQQGKIKLYVLALGMCVYAACASGGEVPAATALCHHHAVFSSSWYSWCKPPRIGDATTCRCSGNRCRCL